MITVLFPLTPFTYFNSVLPFFLSRHRKEFHFTTDIDFVLKHDRNRILILARWFRGDHPAAPSDPSALLRQLRSRYDRIIYFDDGASTSSALLHLLPQLDLFLCRQVFQDRQMYLKHYKDNRIFAEYAIDHLGASPGDEAPHSVAEPDQLHKIRVAWSLGIGQYPPRWYREQIVEKAFPWIGGAAVRMMFRRPPRPAMDNKHLVCHARFSPKGFSEAIGFQRAILLKQVTNDGRFLSGFIDKKMYNKELASVAAVLSPYGWGEVCFRDFEAIVNGAVLIKPSMEHVETWPHSYRPWENFAPIAWDGSNLGEVVDRVLGDTQLAKNLREAAWDDWDGAFDRIEDRVELVMGWCLGEKE